MYKRKIDGTERYDTIPLSPCITDFQIYYYTITGISTINHFDTKKKEKIVKYNILMKFPSSSCLYYD
jgi:hypothetical protein